MKVLPGLVLMLMSMLFETGVTHVAPLRQRHHHREMEETMDMVDVAGQSEDEDLGIVRFQPLNDVEEKWNDFKTKHEKHYKDSNEEEKRKQIFEENLKEINLHNERFAKGTETYEKGINQFTDLTGPEFVDFISCLSKRNRSMEERGKSMSIPDELLDDRSLPNAVDWRPTGAVTRVKNQFSCGSCWAFSTVGALEGQVFLKGRGLVESLSEQNLVDCSNRNGGCNGGDQYQAYLDIMKQGGIDTEDSYKYEDRKGSCRYDPKAKAEGAHVSAIVNVPSGEINLQRAVASIGPIAVSIHATDNLKAYKSGIFSDNTCRNSIWYHNHAVLVVGYKSAFPGNDYWIVKNSWGTEWGMDGYVLMTRNKNNQCGIATDTLYPVV